METYLITINNKKLSRRGLVLEGYQAPSGSKEVNPMEAQQLVAQERTHNQSLAAQKQKSNAANTNDTFEYIERNYKPNTDRTNSNVIQQKADKEMNAIHNDAFEYLKKNPNATQFEIAQLFGQRAFNTNQLYTTGKLLKENTDNYVKALDEGYNKSELSAAAQEDAFLNADGTVKADLSGVDPNNYQKYIDSAIENNPMRITTPEGLQKHVQNKEAVKTSKDTIIYRDKNGAVKKTSVEISLPSFLQPAKDAKGFNLRDDNGQFLVEPKHETLPDGTKIVTEDVFGGLPESSKKRANGESKMLLKSFNKLNGTDFHHDSYEVNTIARKLVYEDMLKHWSKGGVKELIDTKEPPAPKITINTGGGKDDGVKIRNVYKEIDDLYNKNKERFGDDYKIPLSELSATAQGVIIKYANELTGGDRTQADMFVQKDNLGKYNIVDLESGKAIAPIDFSDVNMKVQPGAKEKREVIKQADGKSDKKEVKKVVHKAKYKGGIITSEDGVTWFDSKGNKVQ